MGPTSQTQSTTSTDLVHTVDPMHKFTLTWNHYQILMRLQNLQERSFYEIEAYNQNWSVRQLQRQIASSLYERLALGYALVGLSARYQQEQHAQLEQKNI
ncbi:MAG: DUF1016 N-terminal domain-containing protein [Prevotella sp.]